MDEQAHAERKKVKRTQPSIDGQDKFARKPTSHKRNNVSTAIGKKLRAVRLESKLSQENLAFNAQFDRAFISDIERGVANPSIMALATLCYALNITLADLFATINLSLKPGDETRRKNPAKTDSSVTEKKKLGQRQVPKIR